MIHTPQLPRDFVDSRSVGSMGKTMVHSNNRTNQNHYQQQQQQNNRNNQMQQQQQQRPMNGEVQRGGNNYKVLPNPMTAQRVIVQKQAVQNVQAQRLVQRTNPSVPQQREITVREVFTPQNGWKPSFSRPGTQVQQAARVSRGSLPNTDRGVMYVERPSQPSSRPINLHVQPTPHQRNILRQQQLIQHAQPQHQNQLNRGGAQYQKVTIEPPRTQQTQQFQQPQQQRQVKSPNDSINQQRPVSNQMARIQPNPTTSFSRKRSAPTPPTPESVENFVYSPSGNAPKRVKENTDWQPVGMTSQQPTIQKKPMVNRDGSLPDYVRNIAGFEIRVIRSKDPDMRLFPC